MHYVAGFLFSMPAATHVALIRKNRPAYLHGYWNGIGGGVERGETAVAAQSREMAEEAGVVVPEESWKHFLALNTDRGDRIDFFYADWSPMMGMLQTKTAEQVAWQPLDAMRPHQLQLYPNLRYIIPMAQEHRDRGGGPRLLHLIET